MDVTKIHATSSIENAHKVVQCPSLDVRHRKFSTCDGSLLDEQPLKEIPSMKRERTLELLRIYIRSLEMVGHDRGPPIGSEPSVTDCSSNETTWSGASTFSSVGSSISSMRMSTFSLGDGGKEESKIVRPLPEDLRARKALMRYIGCCAACSKTRTRVSILSFRRAVSRLTTS
jgi:hypothetical protein